MPELTVIITRIRRNLPLCPDREREFLPLLRKIDLYENRFRHYIRVSRKGRVSSVTRSGKLWWRDGEPEKDYLREDRNSLMSLLFGRRRRPNQSELEEEFRSHFGPESGLCYNTSVVLMDKRAASNYLPIMVEEGLRPLVYSTQNLRGFPPDMIQYLMN